MSHRALLSVCALQCGEPEVTGASSVSPIRMNRRRGARVLFAATARRGISASSRTLGKQSRVTTSGRRTDSNR